jgi:AraC-like DNA-binding protein
MELDNTQGCYGENRGLDNTTAEKTEILKKSFWKHGLEYMDGRRGLIIERIKNAIIEMIQYPGELPKGKFSDYISAISGYDYTYLSNLFSEVQGITIEHFIIINKIEKVKELLIFNDMTLTEIATLLQYSSTAHLANQFKKITGLTSRHFKNIQAKKRKIV